MLPFLPETVGSHWATDSQVDVVAVNRREQVILLGECQWGGNRLHRAAVCELLKKAPLVVPGEGWEVHYALSARSDFTEAAAALAAEAEMILVDLARLRRDLQADLLAEE